VPVRNVHRIVRNVTLLERVNVTIVLQDLLYNCQPRRALNALLTALNATRPDLENAIPVAARWDLVLMPAASARNALLIARIAR